MLSKPSHLFPIGEGLLANKEAILLYIFKLNERLKKKLVVDNDQATLIGSLASQGSREGRKL